MSPEAREIYAREILPAMLAKEHPPIMDELYATDYETKPVPIRTFITDPYYLGGVLEDSVFEQIILDLQEVFDGEYDEIICVGGIGWGKSRLVELGILYEIYCTSCLRDPAKTYGLMPGSELNFLNVSTTKDQAKRVLFSGLLDIASRCRYFKEKFPIDKGIKSEGRFPKKITAHPVASNETSMLGEGVFSAAIDEANFMDVIEHSKRHREIGTYDHVQVMYDKIKTRIRSRTNQRGRLPGHVWVISSARYPSDFTERMEIAALSDPRIKVIRHATWETHPKSKFMDVTFEVEVGDRGKRSRVLTGAETEVKRENVYRVPMDFYQEFLANPDKSVRDILGRPTLAIRPFFPERDKIQAIFRLGEEMGLVHPFTKLMVTLQDPSEKLIPENLHHIQVPALDPRDRQIYDNQGQAVFSFKIHSGPYYSHNDGAKSNNVWGHCVVHIVGEKLCPRTAGDPMPEPKPIIRVDMILGIVAKPNSEIHPQDVRGLYYQYAGLGMTFGKISYDSFGSMESLSILKEDGYTVENFSVDTDNAPYETLRTAIHDERFICYYHPRLENELLHAEFDEKKGKVDHPAVGSKDLIDAAAAAAYHAEQAWSQGVRAKKTTQPVYMAKPQTEPDMDENEELWRRMVAGDPTLTEEDWERLK